MTLLAQEIAYDAHKNKRYDSQLFANHWTITTALHRLSTRLRVVLTHKKINKLLFKTSEQYVKEMIIIMTLKRIIQQSLHSTFSISSLSTRTVSV